jgi:hypothetical protein
MDLPAADRVLDGSPNCPMWVGTRFRRDHRVPVVVTMSRMVTRSALDTRGELCKISMVFVPVVTGRQTEPEAVGAVGLASSVIAGSIIHLSQRIRENDHDN